MLLWFFLWRRKRLYRFNTNWRKEQVCKVHSQKSIFKWNIRIKKQVIFQFNNLEGTMAFRLCSPHHIRFFSFRKGPSSLRIFVLCCELNKTRSLCFFVFFVIVCFVKKAAEPTSPVPSWALNIEDESSKSRSLHRSECSNSKWLPDIDLLSPKSHGSSHVVPLSSMNQFDPCEVLFCLRLCPQSSSNDTVIIFRTTISPVTSESNMTVSPIQWTTSDSFSPIKQSWAVTWPHTQSPWPRTKFSKWPIDMKQGRNLHWRLTWI